MNIRNAAPITVWFSVIFCSNIIANEIAIYRWVDENNVVHFSQHQPKDGTYSDLTTVSSFRAKEKVLPQKTSPPTIDEQLSKYEKDQAEVLAKNAEIAEKNCKAAQANKEMLTSLDSVLIADDNGKTKKLSDREKKDQLALNEKHIEIYCKQEGVEISK